ncbi:unnamed protein product [Urochloa humidicola]
MVSQGPRIRGAGGSAGPDDGVLPHDTIYEILLRVPARPLCRFRAVCQSWCSLLSDPPFAAAHAATRRSSPCASPAAPTARSPTRTASAADAPSPRPGAAPSCPRRGPRRRHPEGVGSGDRRCLLAQQQQRVCVGEGRVLRGRARRVQSAHS